MYCIERVWYISAGSVLLHDELHRRSGHSGDYAINMDDVEQQRYQQQLQLIDEQVRGSFLVTGRCLCQNGMTCRCCDMTI